MTDDAKVSVPEGAVEAFFREYVHLTNVALNISASTVQQCIAAALPRIAVKTPSGVWRIDQSAGCPILVYENCSVIQDEQAHYVLGLILAANGDAKVSVPEGAVEAGLKAAASDSDARLPRYKVVEKILAAALPHLLAGASQDATGANATPVSDGVRVPDGVLSGKYGDVLRPFIAMMDRELHANAGKGDRPGWLSMSAAEAMLEIHYHAAKLQNAVKNGAGNAICEYAADVANMAMMMVDICGGLVDASPQPPAIATHGADERYAMDAERDAWLAAGGTSLGYAAHKQNEADDFAAMAKEPR